LSIEAVAISNNNTEIYLNDGNLTFSVLSKNFSSLSKIDFILSSFCMELISLLLFLSSFPRFSLGSCQQNENVKRDDDHFHSPHLEFVLRTLFEIQNVPKVLLFRT
jgi:hypothetical protein